jgi:hypothetical protein
MKVSNEIQNFSRSRCALGQRGDLRDDDASILGLVVFSRTLRRFKKCREWKLA